MNVYEIITDKVITKLQAGIIPWRRPWTQDGSAPVNFISKKPYRGANVFLLGMNDYPTQYYLTYKQARDKGGNVRKGEHGHTVIFWKFFRDGKAAEDGSEDTTGPRGGELHKHIPMLRYYTVFNIAQCDGIEAPAVNAGPEIDPIAACDQIVAGMPTPPEIRHGVARAYYRPADDVVNMPQKTTFRNAPMYYATLFHELTHSTGHETRCNRAGITETAGHGSTSYAKEELVAEMGAAFLCGHAHIIDDTLENTAAYIQGWVSRFREQPKMIIHAAAAAQKAADFILNTTSAQGTDAEGTAA
jgi:antirestriction protein ArdC